MDYSPVDDYNTDITNFFFYLQRFHGSSPEGKKQGHRRQAQLWQLPQGKSSYQCAVFPC